MNSRQQQQAAKDFAARWADDSKGHEKQDSQNFWHDLLHTVYGVDNPRSSSGSSARSTSRARTGRNSTASSTAISAAPACSSSKRARA